MIFPKSGVLRSQYEIQPHHYKIDYLSTRSHVFSLDITLFFKIHLFLSNVCLQKILVFWKLEKLTLHVSNIKRLKISLQMCLYSYHKLFNFFKFATSIRKFEDHQFLKGFMIAMIQNKTFYLIYAFVRIWFLFLWCMFFNWWVIIAVRPQDVHCCDSTI